MYLNKRRASMALCLSIASVASYAQSTLKGTVKDAQGEPMIGVTIKIRPDIWAFHPLTYWK